VSVRVPALVFDTSVLSAFVSAQQLAVLRDFGATHRLVTTQAVIDELGAADGVTPDLTWMEVAHVDSLAELRVLVRYAAVLGSGEHDMGEATVMTWAEVHEATALIDDEAAKRAGRRRKVSCHGTLWLVIEAYKADRLDVAGAESLVDRLAETNARFPCDGASLFAWARQQQLLE